MRFFLVLFIKFQFVSVEDDVHVLSSDASGNFSNVIYVWEKFSLVYRFICGSVRMFWKPRVSESENIFSIKKRLVALGVSYDRGWYERTKVE